MDSILLLKLQKEPLALSYKFIKMKLEYQNRIRRLLT